MHELGITQNIVAIVSERARSQRVTGVTIVVGKLSAVCPQSIRFCFDVVSHGTLLEGAELEIVEIDGTAECRACGTHFTLEHLYGHCPCGSHDLIRLTGEELLVKEMVTA
jgi:hydrogenase nickel incorporation protein HypA/HybF